jgi:hypothetical protein
VLLVAKLDRLARSVAFLATLMESRVRFQTVDLPAADESSAKIMAPHESLPLLITSLLNREMYRMNRLNYMIAALFISNKSSMKYSGNSARLFIAKLTFSLMTWLWVFFVVKVFENKSSLIEYISRQTYCSWVIYFILVIITNYCTWNLTIVEQMVDDSQHTTAIANAKRELLWLFITGFVLLMSASVYYS